MQIKDRFNKLRALNIDDAELAKAVIKIATEFELVEGYVNNENLVKKEMNSAKKEEANQNVNTVKLVKKPEYWLVEAELTNEEKRELWRICFNDFEVNGVFKDKKYLGDIPKNHPANKALEEVINQLSGEPKQAE